MLKDYTIAEMASECAQFADDNSPAEPGWNHSPAAMWQSIHDREGVSDSGPMPQEFAERYVTRCLAVGGLTLLREVMAHELGVTPFGACSKCGNFADGNPLCPECDFASQGN